MDLLTNKVFSKLNLSENFRKELFLNRGLELRCWKLIILRAFFCKTSQLIAWQQGLIQGKVEVGHRVWDTWVWDQKSKMEENKILPTFILYTSSSRSTVMIFQCIKSCFICLCECTSSDSCYPVFAYLPFLFWFASKHLFKKSNHGSYLRAFYL